MARQPELPLAARATLAASCAARGDAPQRPVMSIAGERIIDSPGGLLTAIKAMLRAAA